MREDILAVLGGGDGEGTPGWVSAEGTVRLLAAASPAGSPDLKPNVTVAADVKTIEEALEKVPLKSAALYVVYVKAGTYKEYVSLYTHAPAAVRSSATAGSPAPSTSSWATPVPGGAAELPHPAPEAKPMANQANIITVTAQGRRDK
ncbi:hypothetical protein U9M48_034008 [Paspalum notatum var. saurae]|uniref:Pectinesterase catalytic domain-containing protein n=1 Tax=Paspalum notatum var. saurae TaxID=547442 RepID=A0AAQ3UBP7_PASNO